MSAKQQPLPPALSEAERIEMGLDMASKFDRPDDSELRILIFTATYFILDGVTLTIRRIENQLRSKGTKIKILTTVPDNVEPEQIRDVIVVPGIKIPFTHAGEYAFGVGLDEGTIRAIEAFRPNCVHFTVPDFVALDGIRWCQRNNVAYIATWHSNFGDYLKYYFLEWILGPGLHRYLKGFYEQIPTVYVPTNYMLKKMREEWGYGECTELKEWGRGVDMNCFSPERRSTAFRASKGIDEDDVAVLWVARLVPEKRPDIWMSVVKALQDEGLPVKAVVVGSGTFEKYLAKLKHVSCCGWLSGTALGEAYASCDVLLFPSDVETFGNVTLEALSSGCPAIVEKKCGEHLVQDGKNGFTCPSGDRDAFYQATRKIVVDTILRKQMAKAARESAWKFERSIILQQMAENYKDAIVKHRDPAFLKRHLQTNLGAGRNLLSVLCCNYYFIKILAEPFLNTSKNVQDMVDSGAECIQMSRSRLSCSEFLASHGTSSNVVDLEDGSIDSSRYHEQRKKNKKSTGFSLPITSSITLTRLFHYLTVIISVAIILIFIYASFTV